MKWVLLAIVLSFFSVFAPLYYVFGQDAKQGQLLLMPGILNECDQIINSLEANTKNSNRIISDLQMKTNTTSTITEMLQRQLNLALENYQTSEQTAQEKFKNYESSLQSLETSYKASLTLNQEQEKEIAVLKDRISSRNKIIFGMGIGLAVAIALIIIIWRLNK